MIGRDSHSFKDSVANSSTNQEGFTKVKYQGIFRFKHLQINTSVENSYSEKSQHTTNKVVKQ